MRVFVTGHQQFESSHLIKPWLLQGHQVYGLDFIQEPTSLPAVLGAESLPLESHLVEKLSLENLQQSLLSAQPDIVLHLMQSQHQKANLKDYHLHYQKNVESTVLLFQALELTGLRPKWIGVSISDRMNGQDAHSLSHVQRSQLCDLFKKHSVTKLTYAALIGEGDLRESSLFYQMLQSFLKEEKFLIKKPHSVRSFQSAAKAGHYLYKAALLRAAEPEALIKESDSKSWCLGPESSDMLSVMKAAEAFADVFNKQDLLEFYKEERGASFQPSPDCTAFYQKFETLDFVQSPEEAICQLALWYRQHFALKF